MVDGWTANRVPSHAQPVAAEGGQELGGQAELDRAGRTGGLATRAAAGGVQPLLADGGELDCQGGAPVLEVVPGDPGQRRAGQGVQELTGAGGAGSGAGGAAGPGCRM
jgi:hypothetical protein